MTADSTPDDPKARLSADIVAALKAGEKVRLAALRFLAYQVKNREVELRRELTAEEVGEVATRDTKRRRESIEAFEAGGRQDLVDKERAELAALESYLPPSLSVEELDRLVEEAVAETGAATPAQMGQVMKALMPKVKGRADGAVVSARVRAQLGG